MSGCIHAKDNSCCQCTGLSEAEKDVVWLRARVAELELERGGSPCLHCGRLIPEGIDCRCPKNFAKLQARVAELEADNVALLKQQGAIKALEKMPDGWLNHHARLSEDLTRKREECERLELLLGDVRIQCKRIAQERDLLRTELGAAMGENAKLRRKLREK
jgi:hypothetical protein